MLNCLSFVIFVRTNLLSGGGNSWSAMERPETVSIGTNKLIGTDPSALRPALDRLFAGQWESGSIPEKWDGKTGGRIVAILERLLEPSKA